MFQKIFSYRSFLTIFCVTTPIPYSLTPFNFHAGVIRSTQIHDTQARQEKGKGLELAEEEDFCAIAPYLDPRGQAVWKNIMATKTLRVRTQQQQPTPGLSAPPQLTPLEDPREPESSLIEQHSERILEPMASIELTKEEEAGHRRKAAKESLKCSLTISPRSSNSSFLDDTPKPDPTTKPLHSTPRKEARMKLPQSHRHLPHLPTALHLVVVLLHPNETLLV